MPDRIQLQHKQTNKDTTPICQATEAASNQDMLHNPFFFLNGSYTTSFDTKNNQSFRSKYASSKRPVTVSFYYTHDLLISTVCCDESQYIQ